MVDIVLPSKLEFAVQALYMVPGTLFIIVDSNILPGRQIHATVFAFYVFLEMCLEPLVANYLLAYLTFDLELVQDVNYQPTYRLEVFEAGQTFIPFADEEASFLLSQVCDAFFAVVAFTATALHRVPQKVLANEACHEVNVDLWNDVDVIYHVLFDSQLLNWHDVCTLMSRH